MRVWLYYRLSRDEDKELNSLTNQREILVDYANEKNYEIVGESFDDNVSGMHFNREGITEITFQVDKGNIDAILVKDLSRLGRHKTQTSLFIDYLRQHDVKVISITENLDSSNESDDMMIGFKGLFNDMYARDISKKVRAAIAQKKKKGLIIKAPLGYYKDKNTNEIIIIEEQAEIVREIFNLYLQGYGFHNIASILNERGIKSPGYYQNVVYTAENKAIYHPKPGVKYMWERTSVKRIIDNEIYIGNIINNKSYTSKVNHIQRELPEEEWMRAENVLPPIISKDVWDKVRALLKTRTKNNVRAGKRKPLHRYTGLIKCGDCGSAIVCRKRKRYGIAEIQYEYVCSGNNRFGKKYCPSSHNIHEEVLDQIIYDELNSLRDKALDMYKNIEGDVKNWLKQKNTVDGKLELLRSDLSQKKSDEKQLLIERARDIKHKEVYDEILTKYDREMKYIEKEIESILDYRKTIKERKVKMKKTVELIDSILEEGAISDANLRLLIEKIVITEKDDKLHLQINLRANFNDHMKVFTSNDHFYNLPFQTNKAARERRIDISTDLPKVKKGRPKKNDSE